MEKNVVNYSLLLNTIYIMITTNIPTKIPAIQVDITPITTKSKERTIAINAEDKNADSHAKVVANVNSNTKNTIKSIPANKKPPAD